MFEENLDKQAIEDYFKTSDTLLGEQSYDYKAEIVKYSKDFEDYGDYKRLEVIIENKGNCSWESDISSLDCIPEFSTLLCKNYYFEEEVLPGDQVTIYLQFLNDEAQDFGEPPYFTFLQLHIHPRFFNPMLVLDFSHAFDKKENDKNEKKIENKNEIKDNDNYENDNGNAINVINEINENNEDNKIKEMEKKIAQLEKKDKDREKKNKKIENEKKQLNAKYKELEEKNKLTEKENEKINKKLSESEKKLEILEKENQKLKQIKNNEQKNVKKVEEKLLDIEKKYELINKENKELKGKNKNNPVNEINKEKEEKHNMLGEEYGKIVDQIEELLKNAKELKNRYKDSYNIDDRPNEEYEGDNNKEEEPIEEKEEKEEEPEEENNNKKEEPIEEKEEEPENENNNKKEGQEESKKEKEEELEEENNNKKEEPLEEKKEYSYEYINKNSLSVYKYVGETEANIEIVLKNNGIINWPENDTKLIYDKSSDLISNDIKLDPLAPNEEKSYQIKLKGLKKYKVGEYNCFFSFCINGEKLGEKITLTLILREKEKNDDLVKHQQEINDFRDTFGLEKEDYSDAKLLETLKKHDFDFESAFSSLFD